MRFRFGRVRNEELAKQLASSTNIDLSKVRWPGNGPWSHLPPWERPGWKLFGGQGRGRGQCIRYLLNMLRERE